MARPCSRHKSHICPEEKVFSGACCPCCGWTTDRCPRLDFDEANREQALYEDHNGPSGIEAGGKQ